MKVDSLKIAREYEELYTVKSDDSNNRTMTVRVIDEKSGKCWLCQDVVTGETMRIDHKSLVKVQHKDIKMASGEYLSVYRERMKRGYVNE